METKFTLTPDDYLKEERGRAQTEARAIISEAPNPPTNLHVDDVWTWRQDESFGSFFDHKSVLFSVLGFIALFVAVALILYFSSGGNIWLAIFAPLGGAIGIGIVTGGMGVIYPAVVIGLLIKLIISPIFYPIYKSKCRAWNKENPTRIMAIKAALDERVAAYTAKFEAAATEAAEIYASHEITSMVSEKIKTGFLSSVKMAKRTADISTLGLKCTFWVSQSGIKHTYGNAISFEDYRCKPLPDRFAMAAYGYAVADGVIARIMGEMERDPSGTDYEISKSYSYDEDGALKVLLTYSAKNGNFEELSDWGASGAVYSGKE